MLDCQIQLSIFLVFCEAKKYEIQSNNCSLCDWTMKSMHLKSDMPKKKTLWKMVEHFGYPDSEKECSEMASVIF